MPRSSDFGQDSAACLWTAFAWLHPLAPQLAQRSQSPAATGLAIQNAFRLFAGRPWSVSPPEFPTVMWTLHGIAYSVGSIGGWSLFRAGTEEAGLQSILACPNSPRPGAARCTSLGAHRPDRRRWC